MPQNDKLPIMDHEVDMSHEDLRERSVYMKQFERPAVFRLAIITLILFVCAMLFLFLFLVTPIFYSLNHPITESGNKTHESMPMSSDEAMPHEHSHEEGEDRRKRSVEETIQTLIKNHCNCGTIFGLRDLEDCHRKCFNKSRGEIPKKP